MPIYSIYIYDDNNKIVSSEHQLNVSILYRYSIINEITSVINEIVKNIEDPGGVITQNFRDYKFNILFSCITNYKYIVITDSEYPTRIGFQLIKLLSKNHKDLQSLIKKYQDPKNVDKIEAIQQELNETKGILYNSIEQIINRGERIDDIQRKTNILVFESKSFEKKAADLNRCCAIL